jgi:DNA-binding beta-propeller fold protein YncE
MTKAATAAFAVLAALFAAGCHGSDNQSSGTPPDGGVAQGPDGGSPDGGSAGAGSPTTAIASANNPAQTVFSLALDAAPSPDGAKIYFVAVDPQNGPGVFSTDSAAGSTPAVLASGGAFGAPLGIAVSSDGSTLYVADPAGFTSADQGVLYRLPAAGGTPAQLDETLDLAPRSVAVAKVGSADVIAFIGTDKATGANTVFEDASGQVTALVSGNDPAAVAIATDGTVYVLDQAGTLAKIAAGATAATALPASTPPLNVSFPSGMDVSQDQTALLVSGFDPATGKEWIARVAIATGAVTQLTLAPALTGTEPAGLHRAANADVYDFVDTGAGVSGTVYLIK